MPFLAAKYCRNFTKSMVGWWNYNIFLHVWVEIRRKNMNFCLSTMPKSPQWALLKKKISSLSIMVAGNKQKQAHKGRTFKFRGRNSLPQGDIYTKHVKRKLFIIHKGVEPLRKSYQRFPCKKILWIQRFS